MSVITNPFEHIDNRLNGLESLLIEIKRNYLSTAHSDTKEKDFTRIQAAEEIQISLKTLNTLLRSGQIEYYNIGRHVRITRAAIEKFKESQKH